MSLKKVSQASIIEKLKTPFKFFITSKELLSFLFQEDF